MTMVVQDLQKKVWWSYLEEDLQGLLTQSQILLTKSGSWDEKFHDYSFIVFPASKAYEGFLKKAFLDLGFIRQEDYYGKHFRIGKALNPNLEEQFRAESVYDKIVTFCGGGELADKLWDTWKNCRNLVFHWFPEEKKVISFDEAGVMVAQIIETIDAMFKECKMK